MTRREKRLIYFLAAICSLAMGLLVIAPAIAHDITINNITNHYHEPPPAPVTTAAANPMTITYGVSDRDLAKGIATAMAAGGHQFDFSYSGWQGSITGAWQLSEEEENNASFALGKRFKESFMPNTLLHVTYTPNGDDDWLMVGGTFRF